MCVCVCVCVCMRVIVLGNEVEVGAGIRRAIVDGLVTREQLWITSKLWNTFHAPEHVELAARKSLADLGIEYFDLCKHFVISIIIMFIIS